MGRRGTISQSLGAGGKPPAIDSKVYTLTPFSLGVMLGVYASGMSGGHINPAVTLASCVFRKFPWRKFPIYAVSQVLGAMAGAFIVYGNYKSAIDVYEGGTDIRTVPGYSETATGGIFCTYPAPFMTRTGMFFSEFIASSILMFMIFALKDDGNMAAGPLVPLALFFVIFGIGACFGWETGYAINLARDFGPRLTSYILGYGTEVWTAGNYYFWVCCLLSRIYAVANPEWVGAYRRPVSWVCLWRLALRHVSLHWRGEPSKYPVYRSEAASTICATTEPARSVPCLTLRDE